ncbi:flagellin [Telmatospirillum sp.]|uniref:flagellin n=1 Tax=Telmatospirillum sp. TaxID=2079197 RepID=UPI002846CAF3|nr:flagellin [Telmatospirillum sp.]MDR3440135.1 flagellin [Telmatospirillum sp.]
MSSVSVNSWAQSGLFTQLVSDNAATKAQFDTLTEQSASGKVADTYGGLGTSARVSLSLRPQMSEITTWQQNVTAAGTTLDTTQSVLKQLQTIASDFSSDALGTDMEAANGAQALATQATQALQQVVTLLNTAADGQYTFAGTDSANPPISTTDLASFSTTVASQVAGLSTGTDPTTLVSDLLTSGTTASFAYPGSATSGTTPSALLTTVGTGHAVTTAFVAGVNSFATQTGSSTTGSYVRDIVTALAGLAGLSTTTASQIDLQSFGSGISQILQNASTAIETEEAGFGEVQSELTTRGTDLSDLQTSLTKQVSSVEDADMTATATALSEVQTQLQASYKIISTAASMSLVTYL